MKTQAFVLAFLLTVSQAYAWDEREQSVLLGFIGGVMAASIYDHHVDTKVYRDVKVVHDRPVINIINHHERARKQQHIAKRFHRPHEKYHRRYYTCEAQPRPHHYRDRQWR